MEKHKGCFKINQQTMAIFLGFSIRSLICFDRGAVGSIVHLLKSDHTLDANLIYVGFIGFVPIVGYVLGIPLYGLAKKYLDDMKILGLGLFIWACSALAFAVFESYRMILVARAFTGLGEAAFSYLAPSYILGIRTDKVENAWFTSFYAFLWVGYGLGYLMGTGLAYNGNRMGVFIAESVMMLIFAVLIFSIYIDPESITQDTQSELLINQSQPVLLQESPSLLNKIKTLINNPTYVCIVLGYAAVNFTISGYIFWVISI